MHHRLLGSTALVGAGLLFAGGASAQELEVSLGGYSEFGVKAADKETLSGGPDRGYLFFMDNEVHPSVLGTSDTGVEYGTTIELEVGSGDGNTEDATIDEATLFFSGAFGRIELGRDDGAEDVMFLGGEDAQSGTGGFDGDTANLIPLQIQDSGDSAKVSYFTPRVGGFQLGASFVPDEGDGVEDSDVVGGDDFENSFGVGANWTTDMNGFDLGLTATAIFAGNEDDDVDDKTDWSVGGRAGVGGLQFGAAFIQRTDFAEANIINAGLKYSFGPASASVGFVRHDPDEGEEQNLFAVSGDVQMLPGVVLKGDVTYNDEDFGSDDDPTTTDDTIAGVLTVQISY